MEIYVWEYFSGLSIPQRWEKNNGETQVSGLFIFPAAWEPSLPGELLLQGGTLRLGAYPCRIAEGTKMRECYGMGEIFERHRHRYEFNNEYRAELISHGLVVSGTSPDGSIVETVEAGGNRFYVGVQFHREFKSRPNRPHPLFLGFISAAIAKKEKAAD